MLYDLSLIMCCFFKFYTVIYVSAEFNVIYLVTFTVTFCNTGFKWTSLNIMLLNNTRQQQNIYDLK